jgi:hypothetical protein
MINILSLYNDSISVSFVTDNKLVLLYNVFSSRKTEKAFIFGILENRKHHDVVNTFPERILISTESAFSSKYAKTLKIK